MASSSRSSSSGGVRLCWFLLVLVVAGSFVATLVHLSSGLHGQLLTCKDSLFSLREQLIGLGDEKLLLMEQKKEEKMKSEHLREKSKTVLDELLTQQKKVKALQYELLSAREDLNGMIENCTGDSNELRAEFNLTMDVLKAKVTTNMEYRSLLKKTLEEKFKLENSLEAMHYTVFNLTQELATAKKTILAGKETIQRHQQDITKMSDQVQKANQAMTHAAQLLKKERSASG